MIEFRENVTEQEVIDICSSLTQKELEDLMFNYDYDYDDEFSLSTNIQDFAYYIISLNDEDDDF